MPRIKCLLHRSLGHNTCKYKYEYEFKYEYEYEYTYEY